MVTWVSSLAFVFGNYYPTFVQICSLTYHFHHFCLCHPGLDGVHIPLRDRASCLKPSQPRAPCFPSRHSFLPEAPLEEGGSSSDRTTQTASQPRPDAFLKTEHGCAFSSTICPFISYISTISCALSGLCLLFIRCVQTASIFQEREKHSNKFLRHEWWGWRPRQCVTVKRATSMAIYKTVGSSWDSPAFEKVICSSVSEYILFIGSKLCLKPMVMFSATTHWCHDFCLRRFQRHVHTYRILPDSDGLLAVQVSFWAELSFHKPISSSSIMADRGTFHYFYTFKWKRLNYIWLRKQWKDKSNLWQILNISSPLEVISRPCF